MTRAHIDFVQVQTLPWADNLLTTHPGVSGKLLSRDDATGAMTAILRYPAGWVGTAEAMAVSEEVFVLDGQLEMSDQALGRDCYAFWPSGMSRKGFGSPGGAVALTFLEPSSAMGSPLDHSGVQPVRCVDVRRMEWKANLAAMGLEVMAQNARISTLRHDPLTGDITYITAAIPYWRESQPERHPVSQEFFVLSGEVAGPTGLLKEGAYVWRPPHCSHGPYGSTTGAVMLFRSTGGKFSTTHGSPQPLSFEPPYRPILPPDMAHYGEWIGPEQTRY